MRCQNSFVTALDQLLGEEAPSSIDEVVLFNQPLTGCSLLGIISTVFIILSLYNTVFHILGFTAWLDAVNSGKHSPCLMIKDKTSDWPIDIAFLIDSIGRQKELR